MGRKSKFSKEQKVNIYRRYLDINCKVKLELRNWDKGACPFIPIRTSTCPFYFIIILAFVITLSLSSIKLTFSM